MTCQEVQDWTVAYLELDLDASCVREVTTHLEGCAGCRAEMEAVRQVLVRLKGRTVTDPGRQFWREFPAGVRRQLREAQGKEGSPQESSPHRLVRNRIPFRAWPLALAASVMLVAGAWLLASRLEPPHDGLAPNGQTVVQAPVKGLPDGPDPVEVDWPGAWYEDPDTVLVEMAASLDRRTVDRLFGEI
jgi:anti-sigma factor RsiW